MKTITLDMLYALDACQDGIDLFARTFGQTFTVTPDACAEAAHLFNGAWAADNLLPSSLRPVYALRRSPLWAEYVRKRGPVFNPAWATFTWPSSDVRHSVLHSSWAEYERRRKPHWLEYERQCARLFATLFLNM